MRAARGRAGPAAPALAALALAAIAGAPIRAAALGRAPQAPTAGPVLVGMSVTPAPARIGEPVRVVYVVQAPAGVRVAFPARPTDDSLWTWSEWRTRAAQDTPAGVRHRLVAVGLPFRTGRLALPAPRFRVTRPGQAPALNGFRPTALVVQSVLPRGDARPDIRGLKPPLAPPWWALVPWWVLGVVAIGLALGWWLWRRWRRRPVRGRARERSALVPVVPAHVEALAALDALVREQLPERGEWLEHQTRLTALVRHFLERRFGSPQPGYTTRELCLHLVWRGLPGAEVERLRALLRVADLTKFARAEPTLETARRHEAEARALILAWAEPEGALSAAAPGAARSGEAPAGEPPAPAAGGQAQAG